MVISRRFGRSRFTLAILVLASLTVLTLDFRDSGPVDALRGVAATVFDPVRSAGKTVADPFANGWNGMFGYDDLKKANERLRKQVDTLKAERVDADVARRENAALKAALGIKQTSDIPTVAARITSGPLTSFDATLQIDRGSGDGVKKGMAVVTAAGLVGRVLRVTGGRSTIELITDPSSRFGIRLAKQGDLAIAQGSGRSGTLDVDGRISTKTVVRRGDAVVTSGNEDSPFPAGVIVGRVQSVGFTSDRGEKTLVVDPNADLSALTYVTVLLCDTNCT